MTQGDGVAKPANSRAFVIRPMGPSGANVPRPIAGPSVPDTFGQEVGNIALTWSYVEDVFTNLLHSLEAASPPTGNAQRRNGFSDLVERWRRAQAALLTNCPSLIQHLSDLLDRLGEYQWRRNFLIHGRVECHVKVRVVRDELGPLVHGDVELIISSKRTINGRKQPVREVFTLESLADMFAAVAHIAG